MIQYLMRRLLLLVPTLLGIMLINFVIINTAPGGPVEQAIAQIRKGQAAQTALGAVPGTSSAGETGMAQQQALTQKDFAGIDPELYAQIEQRFGFDKPLHERFWIMLKQYATFDFGSSFFRDVRVIDLIVEKLPVSISLGLWGTLLVYGISIPLGIRKAVRDGSRFDVTSSFIMTIAYAVPGFMFAILLVVLFAGGSFLSIFPLRGLASEYAETWPWWQQVLDYLWHMVLPISALVMSGFASLAMLTKNSFLDEMSKSYVRLAYAKGLDEKRVLYGHVFRNAMLIVIAGFPSAFIGIFLTGSVLIEVIFSLDGLGLLGFRSIVTRDFPVIFASMYIFTLLGLLMNIISDLTYRWIDPRIDFSGRKA